MQTVTKFRQLIGFRTNWCALEIWKIVSYLANIHGRFEWNDRPFTRADFDSKFTSIFFFDIFGKLGKQFMWVADDNDFWRFFFYLILPSEFYLIESTFSSHLTRHTNIPHTKLMTTQIQHIYASSRWFWEYSWIAFNWACILNAPSFCVIHLLPFYLTDIKCIFLHKIACISISHQIVDLFICQFHRSACVLSIFFFIRKTEEWKMIKREIR